MFAKIRGTQLFFDVDGAGFDAEEGRMVEKPALFLLHGGPGGDHAGFKPATTELRDVAQLVYVDHRGSGRSAPCDLESCTLENNIDDLDALRDYLGLEKICVLGSSYGGMVAQGYALRYPDRVSNLILCVTSPSFRFMEESKRILAERGTADQQRVCEWLWEGSFATDEQLHEYYMVMGPMYALSFDAEKFEENWRKGIRRFELLNRGFSDFLRTFDYIDQLQNIKCPTLVIAGAHDWICPPSQSRLIAERIPRAHLKIFANSSHSVMADEREKFFNVVRGFLTYAEETPAY